MLYRSVGHVLNWLPNEKRRMVPFIDQPIALVSLEPHAMATKVLPSQRQFKQFEEQVISGSVDPSGGRSTWRPGVVRWLSAAGEASSVWFASTMRAECSRPLATVGRNGEV